jgi:hypothetical protein
MTDSLMSRSALCQSACDDRIAEIGALLAEALMRLRAPKSSTFGSEFGESSLHISPAESGDAAEVTAEKWRE